jgi:beta-lactamase regulating signal transducer with metallopeptidase domain
MSLTMHLWQATGLAVVAALLTVALRRAPARTRVGVWLFASIQFFVPLSAFAALGGTAGGQFASGLPAPVLRLFEVPFAVSAIAVAGMAPDGGLPGAWVAVLAIVWAAGVGSMAAWRWREWRAVSKLADAAQPLEHGCEADALRRMCASAGIGAVDLRQTASMIEPAVAGIIRPRLLWPEGLSARLSREEIEPCWRTKCLTSRIATISAGCCTSWSRRSSGSTRWSGGLARAWSPSGSGPATRR